MPATLSARVQGDDAVLGLLSRLGKRPRTYANLIAAGFPEQQLAGACQNFMRSAESPVDRHAARRIGQGYPDDEDLLKLFTRYYDCADWRLQSSRLFFSPQDYDRLFDALASPIAFDAAQLHQGGGREKWEQLFLHKPFDLAMARAKTTLWDVALRRDHYWSRQESYLDLRAANCFQYLSGVIDVAHFTKDQFYYQWEREFRVGLNATLLDFQDALERAVRGWQESRNKARSRARFRFEGFRSGGPPTGISLQQALGHLELDPDSATMSVLRRNFRRLSLQAHPDQGGSAESFRYLSACREIAENWLRHRLQN